VALLSSISLSLEELGWSGRGSKNRDPFSVLCVCTSWLLASPPSHTSHGQIRLHRTAMHGWHPTAPSLTVPPPGVSPSSGILSGSDALAFITMDQVREPVISSGRPLVYLLWLVPPRLSGSPLCVAPLTFFTRYVTYSTVATRDSYVFLGIALPPWMFLKSIARRSLGSWPVSRLAP